MNLKINKNLFATWCGMIVIGYDLFDKEDKKLHKCVMKQKINCITIVL